MKKLLAIVACTVGLGAQMSVPSAQAGRADGQPAAAQGAAAAPGSPSGEAVYRERCAGCHDLTNARIPRRDALKLMPASRILRALDFGVMMNVAYPMRRDEREAVATLLGSGPALLNYDLQTGVSQDPIAVKLAGSSSAICMQCDGSGSNDGSDGKLFLGKDCPAPVACAP